MLSVDVLINSYETICYEQLQPHVSKLNSIRFKTISHPLNYILWISLEVLPNGYRTPIWIYVVEPNNESIETDTYNSDKFFRYIDLNVVLLWKQLYSAYIPTTAKNWKKLSGNS